MEQRQKIKLPLTAGDKFMEAAGYVLIVTLWLYTIYRYTLLPDTIATHFDMSGRVDGYGSKATIFVLPVIGTFSFTLLTAINFYPHVFNYPVKITPQNTLQQYQMATRLIRTLKVMIAAVFLAINSSIAQNMEQMGRGALFILPLVALIIIPVIVYLVRATKHK